MSDALARMAFYLSQAEPWKPDRQTAAQIRRCSACKSWKAADMFSPADHLCRPCRKTLSRNNRRKVGSASIGRAVQVYELKEER